MTAASPEPVSPGASAEAIQQHYDAGNDFYTLWLDPTLSYSCALWQDGDDLQAAQVRKLDYHLDQARVRRGTRLLDVGCGWGALLQRAAEQRDVAQATGLTLSRAQLEHVAARRLPKLEVHLEHWADYQPSVPFDAIVSIGAFEHFARYGDTREEKVANYRAFLQRCWTWLSPSGRLSLQTIAYGDVARDSAPSDLFIAKSVFPESDLPRLADIAEATETIFAIEQVRNDGDHYARTLRVWFEQLRARRGEAVDLVGEETVKRYERYLRMFTYGFQLGSMALYRVTLRRIDGVRRTV